MLDLPRDSVPQLADVSDRLTDLSGWRLCAVPGLVSTADFFACLADRCFPSSQYVRHQSVPFYTPEPDLVQASVAIDALAAIVETLGSRLGDDESTLRDALAQLRLAFVQVTKATGGT